MGEEVEPEKSLLVKLDFDVQVASHVLARRIPVFPVAEGTVDQNPVVEQLGGHGHIEYVGASLGRLIVQTEVQRNVELLQDAVELSGHDFRKVRVDHRRIVDDAGLLVRHETARQQKGHHLLLDLVIRVEGTFHFRPGRRVEVRNVDRE